MANCLADIQTLLDGPAYGQPLANRMKANRVGGRVRLWESVFRAPSSGTAPAIGDKIIWGKLPVKARILGHLSRLDFNADTASCTINLGDQFLATRHLAATAINAAGTATPSAAVFSNTATADTTSGSNVLTNVTVTSTQAVGGFQQSLTVITFTGVSAIGASNVNGAVTGAPTVSLVTQAVGSVVYAVGNDWDSATARTIPAGQTKVHEFLAPAGDTFSVQTANGAIAAAGTSVTLNATAPANDQWNFAIIELRR